jgi:hypothetical protein
MVKTRICISLSAKQNNIIKERARQNRKNISSIIGRLIEHNLIDRKTELKRVARDLAKKMCEVQGQIKDIEENEISKQTMLSRSGIL